ncbi:hypothetical protein LINPERHAP2_LOCUS25054 [Linum perenne]
MDKRAIHWYKDSILSPPKACGGFDFRDFQTFNYTLVAKQVWRILASSNALGSSP